MTTLSDDYDSPWKDAVTRYFPEFMAFYFPVAHGEIDWQQPYVFLEQELAQVVRDAELGRRRVDKLVRVVKRGGMDEWVFVHIDVQGRFDKKFAERVFVYNYRIYDRYRRPVASLAVLADASARWKPVSFHYRLFGCEVGIMTMPAGSRNCSSSRTCLRSSLLLICLRNKRGANWSNDLQPRVASHACYSSANGTGNASSTCSM
jgi:hypothetical protein